MPKKEKQGIVVSDKMDKTVVVKVASYDPHPKYKKIIEFNIMEYCINRMSVLRAANRRLKLEFIDNMAVNANRLMNLVIKGD